MDTDVMIAQLRKLAEEHKDDKVFTFQTRWADVCRDVANRLEEQQKIIERYHKADSFLIAHGWNW